MAMISISKISVALGMIPHAGNPASPYAHDEGAVIRTISPSWRPRQPSSQAVGKGR
jgi:hypothetical protein